uniref:Uncharacterized protein n=1 Tax=Meloidogyne enterolobii TaxID=390850 RepID=A0A6V7VUV6_MELEN|nr:unnamed protein product [Meloidogyne enterolobii]
MVMVVFQTLLACIWGNFSCLSLPSLFPFCGQSLLCFNPTTFFFFFIQCFVCFATKEAAASGLHQSGFVLKPVEADVELSSPTSKAQVPFGMLRASFRRVAWVLVAWRNVPAMCGGITQHLAKDSCDNVQKFRQMLGECSSICFGICRSSSGICLESGFVGVLTAGVWNSPGSAWSSSSFYVGECSG